MIEAAMRTDDERSVGTARLWYGVLIGAFAWKLQLMVNYALVPYACFHEMSIVMHLASAATLGLAASGAFVAFGSWRITGGTLETAMGGPEGRSRFLALSGVVASAYFALIILGQWLPNFVLSPCDGIV